ncbi:MAG TPA: electron transfer flavoprotein beta subunit/FixA family protein [Candidatus Marinimicrobia bacterium]|nr:electron transfer flavoprotein beta subunit/FixA family protein [Candidatus Neomarinimicrobiota bacterium]
MPIKLIVLAKQVPDTHNVTADAMKADGTVNRGALPAIFNPEDLNALEMALEIKDQTDATVTVMTMGPPRAANILREAMYMGADAGILITDRHFAGADTLATSYTLALGIEKVGDVNLILCGRQAIDGDTAQIGPQVAGKLGINQLTYVEEVVNVDKNSITLKRTLGHVSETVNTSLPLLITVTSSANLPRTFGAKRLMKYKKARTSIEAEQEVKRSSTTGEYGMELLLDEIEKKKKELKTKGLYLETWTADDINADHEQIGLPGSPTKVKKVQSVVFAASELKKIEPSPEGIHDMIIELIEDRTFG